MSTLAATNLKHASSASNNIVLDTSGNATFAGTAVPSSSFLRNRIINGDMRIDQRNAGASATLPAGVVTYFVDRWYGVQTGANITGQRVSSGLTAFPSAARLTGASGNTFAEISQRIESVNIADLAGQAVTISFFCAASNATTVRVFTVYPNATDNYTSTTLVSINDVAITSSMTRYSVSLTLPAQAANGYLIGFQIVSGLGAGQTFTITGVQLEVGSVATPFERRQFGQELALCQRYFQKSYDLNLALGSIEQIGSVQTSSDASVFYKNFGPIRLMGPMRVRPSITAYNPFTGSTTNPVRNANVGTNLPLVVYDIGQNFFSAFIDNVSTVAGALLQFHYSAFAEL